MSEVLAIGVSHKTAQVEVRERLSLNQWQVEGFLNELASDEAIDEVAAISTCNRTELYLVTRDPVAAESAALGRLATRAGIRPTELAPIIYALRNCDGARHLFRVSAGLESMVVGESEVLGQVRTAFDTALDIGTTGPLLNRLFHSALRTGKRVRTETAIGERALSVSTVAASLAREMIGDLDGRRVVVLGAGETAELAAKAFSALGSKSVFLANRRRDRALALAQRYDGQAIFLDGLPDQLRIADIVIGATSSPHPIVTAEELSLVVDERNGRPLLLIDLAVPRDIEAACAELKGVTVRDIDDLQAVVARNRSVRAAEAGLAEDIVEDEISLFARWLATLDAVPTISDLHAHGQSVADSVVADNDNRWETMSPADRERVALIAKTVAQRILHEPTLQLRAHGEEGSHGRLETVRDLFGLDKKDEDSSWSAQIADVVALPPRREADGDRKK
ncbi:MAG: glutamyl-tRNA reductase [Actinomycetes bacterium]